MRPIALYSTSTHRQSLRHFLGGNCRRYIYTIGYILLTLCKQELRQTSNILTVGSGINNCQKLGRHRPADLGGDLGGDLGEDAADLG